MGLIYMYGKILKVSNNDLRGNVDDRVVAVYAVFKHVKYMNNYVIFSFAGEYDKNKLYVGSVHMKEKSLVTFEVRNDELDYINKFVTDYMNNTVNPSEYEMIDISNMEKIEIISYTEEDFNGLDVLDKMTIKRENIVVQEEVNERKPIILYVLLVIMILLLVGITYLYLNPDLLKVELKELNCTMEEYDRKVELNYDSVAYAKFDSKDRLISLDREDTYKFDDISEYFDFKDNSKENIYFNISGSYKYDDDNKELKLIYNDNLVIYDYEEVLNYLKSKGYSCIEGTYNE